MNIGDIAERLTDEFSLGKVEARQVVESVLAAITEAAAKGDEVALTGFGKFKVRKTPAREGRNPRTGETMQIAASRKVTFQPGKVLKDAVNR